MYLLLCFSPLFLLFFPLSLPASVSYGMAIIAITMMIAIIDEIDCDIREIAIIVKAIKVAITAIIHPTGRETVLAKN